MRVWSVFSGRTLLLIMSLSAGGLSLSGCAQMTQKAPAEAAPEAAATETVADKVTSKPAPLLSLKQIIQLIENGEYDQARAALETFLAKNPKNSAARDLQKQLTINPVKALGAASMPYTVQTGDTLGGLAARFLGNPMRFVILGRYNGIKRAGDIRVGQTIKIPVRNKLRALPDEPEQQKINEPAAEASDVTSDSTQGAQATASTAAPSIPADNPPTTKPEAGTSKAIVKPLSPADEAKALAAQQAGLAAMQNNQLEKAQREFAKALAIDPSLDLAQKRAAQVRQLRVQRYHEAALVAYRKQHLDEAIALWDKALALNPNYEPALGYRARALELKRRLGQLNGH